MEETIVSVEKGEVIVRVNIPRRFRSGISIGFIPAYGKLIRILNLNMKRFR